MLEYPDGCGLCTLAPFILEFLMLKGGVMRNNIGSVCLLLIGASVLQGCSTWENCGNPGAQHTCYSKKVEKQKALNLFNAAIGGGAAATQLPDVSLLFPSCTRANGDYKCAFRFHQPPGGELSAPINIRGDKAKVLYEALSEAGVNPDCAPGSCTVSVVSLGCRNAPPACFLSRGSAVEVAW